VDDSRGQPHSSAQETASGLAFYSALLELRALLAVEGFSLPAADGIQSLLRSYQEDAGLIPPPPVPWYRRRRGGDTPSSEPT
jgi:hypothetical protein